ncbi:hypothetical protein HU200_001918 [Digitaria exilis]|uniref:Uncharacterized protein n=1 Tax=Digitaria exilis TaxID=1010633 RepID=A0A835FXX9_9POAL|nr:hypothetical protein HU200_001918 [Digitaria exilis]
MKAGRKNLWRACDEGAAVTLAEGESIMQVLTLRGSNVIEVGAMLPWGGSSGSVNRVQTARAASCSLTGVLLLGSFVVVDARGRDQALESGSKIACVVSQVLFHEQVRALHKSVLLSALLNVASLAFSNWSSDQFILSYIRPSLFKSTPSEGSEAGTQAQTAQIDEEPDSDEDDDLPPLEENTNRNRPFELYSDSDSGSDS